MCSLPRTPTQTPPSPQVLYACSRKAQQAPGRQTSDEAEAHEAAGALALALAHPLAGAHHAARAQPAVGEAKGELHGQEVEEVAGDDGAAAANVAEQIEREEEHAGDADAEQGGGAVAKREGQHSGHAARQV